MEKTIIQINPNYSYEIDYDLKVCMVKGNGKSDLNDSIRAIEVVMGDQDVVDFCDVVVDIQALRFHPTFDEVMQLKSALLLVKGSFKNKVALIPPAYLFTLGQLVSALTQIGKLEMRTFKSYESALAWIKLAS